MAIECFLITTEFGAKAKRVYVAIENLMSRHSYLKLCRDIPYFVTESSRT